MEYRHITIERHGAIAECTLHNPPAHTLNARGVSELHDFLKRVSQDPDVRVLVLTGTDDTFAAHYEMTELAEASQNPDGPSFRASPDDLHPLNLLGLALESLAIPTIAAVNGNAGGGGWELALACDFRLMREGGFHFGLPETNVGIIPGAGGTQRMTRLLGTARALDLILHGHMLKHEEAVQYGLANRLLPHEDFRTAALSFARELASRSPLAMKLAKRAIREGAEVSLEQGLRIEQQCFDEALHSEDAGRALKAWIAGEKWEWTGK